MKKGEATFQIGKEGFKESLVETLKNAFKTRENVRVVLLKSSGHTKSSTKGIAEKIVDKLGRNYTYRIVGFTIFIKKWRRVMR